MSKTGVQRRRLTALAREYAHKGYEVNVAPSRSELPVFLQDYNPDIIAESYDDKAVIEVKTGRSLVRAKYLAKLAKAILDNPGWRLELIVCNPQISQPIEDDIRLLNRDDLVKRIEEIRHLLENNQIEAAVLLAWSAIEGGLRLNAKKEGIRLKDRSPSYIAKKMANMGMITQAEFEILLEAIELRNSVIHGYKTAQADSEIVLDMLEIIEDLCGG